MSDAEEREWFCPQCGVLRLGVSYDGGALDEDGCCAGCGCTCCRMSELRAMLAARGYLVERECPAHGRSCWDARCDVREPPHA